MSALGGKRTLRTAGLRAVRPLQGGKRNVHSVDHTLENGRILARDVHIGRTVGPIEIGFAFVIDARQQANGVISGLPASLYGLTVTL
jgi:hypothetical protein